MNKIIKNGIIGIATGLIANVIFYCLQTSNFLEKFNVNLENSQTYIYISLPIIFALIFIVGGRIQKHKRDRWSILVGGTRGRPLIETTRGTLQMFGVKWRVSIGFSGPGEYHAYVEGSYCPKCDCELNSKTEDKFFGWSQKHLWKCPKCGFTINRPKDYLFEEKDAVEKVAISEYEKQNKFQ